MRSPRTRAAAAAFTLLALALVSGVQSASSSARIETCADPDALFDPEGLGLEVLAYQLRGRPRRSTLDGYIASVPTASPLAFTVRRTFELPQWLSRPTTAVPGPKEPDIFETRELEIDGETVNVRVAAAMHRSSQRFSAYILGYEGRPYLSAFWIRMRETPWVILTGTRPITYLGVAFESTPMHREQQERRAFEFIEAAWRHYQRACAP